MRFVRLFQRRRLGTADAEINVLSADNPKLPETSSVMDGYDQNIALRVSPATENSVFLISAFLGHSTSFLRNYFPT